MTDRTIYPCVIDDHIGTHPTIHTHARADGGAFNLNGNPDHSSPYERQTGPDGQQLLFSVDHATTTMRVPLGAHLTTTECTDGLHPPDTHMHSADGARVLWRPVGMDSIYEPIDGLFSKTTTRPEGSGRPTTERESIMSTITPGMTVTASDGRPYGLTAGRPVLVLAIRSGYATCVVGDRSDEGGGWQFPGSSYGTAGQGIALRRLGATGWNISVDRLTVTGRPLPEHLQRIKDALFPAEDAPEQVEQVQLHPLTVEKLDAHPRFTITSKPGTLDGDEVVFGCQRFRLSVIAEGRGSIAFTPEGPVVTMPARAQGSLVRVGDRELGRGDINDWSVRIIANPTPPAPLENAIVMEYGFYQCATHRGGHVLYLLDSVGGPRLGQVRPTSGGVIGQRAGLIHRSLRGCVPVKDSATARTMEITGVRKYALVPVDSGDFSEFVRGHLDEGRITQCDNEGVIVPDPSAPF